MKRPQEKPLGWDYCSLEDLLIFVLGGDWGKDPEYNDSNFSKVLCIRGTELRNWEKDKGSTAVCRKIKKTSLEKRKLHLNDILVEISGGGPDQPVGRTALIDEQVLAYESNTPKVCTNFLRLVRPSKCINSAYLNYYLRNFYYSGEIDKYQSGSNNLRNLKFKDYVMIKVPIAPTNEQSRIVNKLDRLFTKVDSAKTHLDKIPTILKNLRQSILVAAISGKLTEGWRESHENFTRYDYNKITEYEGTPLNELPESWGWSHFSGVATIKSNLVDPMGNPSSIHLAPNHVESGTGNINGLKTVADDEVISNKHMFYSGQIIYSKIRPYLNKVALVDFDGVCSADMYPIEANINTRFLHFYMLSQSFVDWTSQKQGRVVLPKINQKALNAIPVPVPSTEEQFEIVRRVDELFAASNRIEKQYEFGKKHFDNILRSILSKAFRGELTPQDPRDEPAGALIERISRQREEANDSKKRTKRAKTKRVPPGTKKTSKAATTEKKRIDGLNELKIGAELEIDELLNVINLPYEESKKVLFNLIKGDDNRAIRPKARLLWDGSYRVKVIN